MSTYLFNTLNDKEFEELSRDLLQKHFNITLESFKQGKDSGIDLRYSNNSNNEIIIQAKHWYVSGFSRLLRHLLKDELPKIKILNPNRYILVTSIPLSPLNKSEIKKILTPYIKNQSDIFGQDDLNNLITKFPEIEKIHYKLWLTSVNVLQSIITNGIRGRTDFIQDEILKNVRLFVTNSNFEMSKNILNEKRFLLITGEPGVGKTTLAKYLITSYLADGYDLIYIDEKIREAEDLYTFDKKQIFYFDDFLGSNYLEILNPKNRDSSIVNFIERIKKDKDKLLILTTRTTIFNQAFQKSQNFQIEKLDIAQHELKIQDYSKYDKAKILYNHLSFCGLPDEYRNKIIEQKYYQNIIEHKNFNPRLIEFITNPRNIDNIEPNNYLTFINNNLDNPALIWSFAYENQIDDYARFVISTLFSLGNSTKEKVLHDCYFKRLEFEILNGYKKINNPFYSKIKDLLGSFLTRNIYNNNDIYIDFFNPSIVDFLINYFNEQNDEKWRIIESSKYVEQLSVRFHTQEKGYILIHAKEYDRFLDYLRINQFKLDVLHSDHLYISLIQIYLMFPLPLVKNDIKKLFEMINFDEIEYLQYYSLFINLIKKLNNDIDLKEIVIKRWDELILKLFYWAEEDYEYETILELFKIFKQNYKQFSDNVSNYNVIDEELDNFLSYKIDNIIDELKSKPVYEVNQMVEKVNEYYDEIVEFIKKFNVSDSWRLNKLRDWDYEEFVQLCNLDLQLSEEDYYYQSQARLHDLSSYSSPKQNRQIPHDLVNKETKYLSENERIDDLFS